ncbi:MAG: nucleoside 2-deoxyribosyltransferase [Chloroflexi bacterium]|nr:nucleoside 2-deoxyribosyltransferase [Chloroflexota bacterium]MBI5350670.1 nucleoside 2-deoxyribosyltransferase [Chloroflexota bacterium]
MKIFLSIKYHPDHRNRDLIENITRALQPHRVICIARDVEAWGEKKFEARELMQKTFEEIDSSDIVVVELSEKGVGVGIEAGYARAKGKPIITVARRGPDVSETLKGISRDMFIYKDISDLEKFFGTRMSRINEFNE